MTNETTAPDLIERLRFCGKLHPKVGYPENGKLFNEAADALEAAQARIAEVDRDKPATEQPSEKEAARVLLEWAKNTNEHDAWEAAQDAMDEPDLGDASDVFVAALRSLAEDKK